VQFASVAFGKELLATLHRDTFVRGPECGP
jgi:hypothetical protein